MNWDAVGSVGTAVAVLVAAWQLRRNTQQATTDFEDDLSREYRELARAIPVVAHLGHDLPEDEFRSVFPRLFQYIDLSNEQVFLRKAGRVSNSTWQQWRDGIKTNLSQPAFARAWDEVKAASGHRFTELRDLESSGFANDPRRWLSRSDRFKRYWSA
jgi:hypothetical protein